MTVRLTLTVLMSLLVLGLLGGCGEVSGDVSGATEEPSSSAPSSVSPESSAPAEPDGRQVTVYYVGDGPRGPVLFREVRTVGEPDHGPAEQLGLLSANPRDPDYRTAWPSGFLRTGAFVNLDDGVIEVDLADTSLRERPAPMSEAEARASIQQVVYTLQEYAGQALPVRFLLGDGQADRLLGVPVSSRVAAAPVLEMLSLMSLVSPAEGQVVTGSFKAWGYSNGYEATAAWQLWRGDEEVASGATIAADAYNDHLNVWHDRVDVSDLPPGSYTFLASNDEPTDGVDADIDTRTIVVQ